MFGKLKSLFFAAKSPKEPRPPPVAAKPPRIPDNCRAYVIGDIHGRADLLRRLHTRIADEIAALPAEMIKLVIYLGDYIDRGESSREVIDILLQEPLQGCQSIYLRGNHEAEMQDFLSNPVGGHTWTAHGGMATALSYQIQVKARISASDRMKELRNKLVETIPESHQAFLTSLRLRYEVGDYLMVHAGVRPGVALNKQRPIDLLWIREPFLSHEKPFGKMIVHGHTIREKPEITPCRIGIDTGAYHTGRLTCLVLENAERRFLSTK